MSSPRVSVIIPAYNAATWLAGTIRSVLGQEEQDLEVIVVNDGSTDDTAQVAALSGDPRVFVINKVNAGVSAARNTGIEKATGRYITFLDADDAMQERNLSLKTAALEAHGVEWVFGDLRLCDEALHPTGAIDHATDGDVVRTILMGNGVAVPAACSNLLALRSCFTHDIRFDEELSNAADQHIVVLLAIRHRYKRLPLALTDYRVLPGSMSRNIALYEKDHLLLFKKFRALGLLEDMALRRKCMAHAYWAIGGSWWVNAGDRKRALPYLLRAVTMRPALVWHKIADRIKQYRADHR